MSKKLYPLYQVSQSSTLIQLIIEVQNKDDNWKYFEIYPESPISFILRDSDNVSEFSFSCTSLIKNEKVSFKITASPGSPGSMEPRTYILDHKDAYERFITWLNLIQQYDKVVDYSDPNFNQHVNEWVEYFELVDEKADEGLSNDQILALNQVFNQWQIIIEQEPIDDQKILNEEINILQQSLHTTSKKKFVRNLGKLLTKIMHKSPQVLFKILKFASKESFKELIQRGTGELLDWFLNSNILPPH